MSASTTERPTRPDDLADVDRDGLDVYCPDAQTWSRTYDLFCENCGATGHDLR